MENIRHQFPNLEIFYIPEFIVIVHCIFCFILNPKSLSFTWSQSVVFIRFHSLYHSLSFVVIRYHLLYHSLSYSLSFVFLLVVIRCTTPCHSLYLAAIRCHSLYHSLPLVATRCTTRLPFYKRSSNETYLDKSMISPIFLSKGLSRWK